MKIKKIVAREILDSRGNPTVEVEISDGNNVVQACVPSGASTGIHEAHELRDEDKKRYNGKGVLQAVHNVNTLLAPAIEGMDPASQEAIDQKMIALDGTPHKSKLGANALLGISLASARLASVQKKMPLFQHIQEIFNYGDRAISLPRPMMNILNGGSHADSGLAIQEFMISPTREDFSENLRIGAEIFHTLKKLLSEKGLSVGVGDEGGFAPRIPTVEGAFDVILEAIEKTGYKPETDVELAIDAAASEFFRDGVYTLDQKPYNAEALVDFYGHLIRKYPIFSIEDSHAEDDFDGFRIMQEKFGNEVQLVGDDLLVTNRKRLALGIDEKLCNSILIKLNQIGTLTETFETMKLAKDNNFTTVISHRSGETEDSFIADLAVGTNAGQIKTGSLSRSERICKYNQLLRISEVL